MCRADKSFDPFAESTVDGIIAGAVTVKVSQIQIWKEVQSSHHDKVHPWTNRQRACFHNRGLDRPKCWLCKI